jgi:ParB family transcriptional regulator, chromosome partitioning protein
MSLHTIPLHRLVQSELNARRTDRKADIEALAASIKAHGLLQNLSVVALGQDRYAVSAGARRHAALKLLAKSGDIARDFAVPCHVIESEAAAEASLAENIQRIAMNAMDEVEAFAALAQAGSSLDDIARRFGCGARHVEQRLALARLSPKLRSAYRRGDLSLDAARAFCLVDDHAIQERVYKSLSKPVTHAREVRAQLMQGRMRASDRLARFVGLEAYGVAGGHITNDLFDERESYVDDADLLNRLASEKLDKLREELLAQGWGWVNVNLGHGRFEGHGVDRIHPTRRPLSEEEQTALAAVEAELDALDEELENSEEDDAGWDKRNDLEAKKQNILEPSICWDPALMALAGAVVSVDHDGAVQVTHGLIAKEDRAKVKRLRQGAATDDASAGRTERDEFVPPWAAVSSLPKAIVRDLTRVRTRALREALSLDRKAALALAVFAMVERGLRQGQAAGVQLDLRFANIDDESSLEAARAALADIIPRDEAEALAWLLEQPIETLLEIFAVVIASAVDLIHEGVSIGDKLRQARADMLAVKLGLDMGAKWKVDGDFLARLPKATLLGMLREHLEATDLNGVERSCELKQGAKLKRGELANRLAQFLSPTGWLPDVLQLPVPETPLELTETGLAAIAAA